MSAMIKFKGIKGKIVLISVGSIVVLAMISSMIYNLNFLIGKNIDVISDKQLNENIDLLVAIEKVKENQSSFLLNNDDKFLIENNQLIDANIRPAIALIETELRDFNPTLLDSIKQGFSDIIVHQTELKRNVTDLQTTEASTDSTLVPVVIDIKDEAKKIIEAKVLPSYKLFQSSIIKYGDWLENKSLTAKKSIKDDTKLIIIVLVSVVMIGFLTLVGFLIKILSQFKGSILLASKQLEALSHGVIPEIVNAEDSEVGELIASANKIAENLNNASMFALSIGEGKYDVNFSASSEKDILSNSLLQMRDKLMQVTEEDKIRTWSIVGLAKIVEIIRAHSTDFSGQMDDILSYVVKYVGATQGGIFILNTEDEAKQFLELKACYAYERKKFIQKRVEIGEGLVGQSFLEKEIIYMTKVPPKYVVIKSGLGDAAPGSILVVPLKLNDTVEGIIELASFRTFKKHEIEFIEKIGETIASAISSVKVAEKTAYLLSTSQEQTEQMRAQEEEMRQNLEELQATQEQMQRKEREMEDLYQQTLSDKQRLEEKIAELQSK